MGAYEVFRIPYRSVLPVYPLPCSKSGAGNLAGLAADFIHAVVEA